MYEVFTEVKQIGATSGFADVSQAVRTRMRELEAAGIAVHLEMHGDDYTTLFMIHILEEVATPPNFLPSKK